MKFKQFLNEDIKFNIGDKVKVKNDHYDHRFQNVEGEVIVKKESKSFSYGNNYRHYSGEILGVELKKKFIEGVHSCTHNGKVWSTTGNCRWFTADSLEKLGSKSKYLRQLKFESLNEEVYKTVKMNNYTLEIYKNPKNIEEITNKHKYIVRAFLTSDGDLFCWDGDTPALHDSLEKILNINKNDIAIVFKNGKVGISFSMLPYDNPDDVNIRKMLIKKVSNSPRIKKLVDVTDIEFGEFN